MTNSYTTILQSEALSDILPVDSADMHYPLPSEQLRNGRRYKSYMPIFGQGGFGSTPCWTLDALLNALPKRPKREYNLVISADKPYFAFDDLELNVHEDYEGESAISACVNMILELYIRNIL